jgi:ABC-type bacteriocin/lantibiotic exporter with double-glycine peptidase domain
MILSYLKGIKRFLFIGFIAGILSSYILSFVPIFYSNILQFLISSNPDFHQLYYLLFIYFSYNSISNLFAGIRGYIFTVFIEFVITKIKNNVISTFFHKNIQFYYHNNLNDIINLFITDTRNITEFYLYNSNLFIRNFTQFITISLILLPLSSSLYFITLFLSFLHIFIEYFYTHFIFIPISSMANDISLKQNNLIIEYINKIETYRSLYLEPVLFHKFSQSNLLYQSIKFKDALFYGLNLFFIHSLNDFFFVIIIFIGKYFSFSNDIILLFVLYKSYFYNITRDFNEIRRNFIKNHKSISNLTLFLSYNNNTNSSLILPPSNFNPNIHIKNLTFSYDDNYFIFSNFNLTIHKNTITGFKGKSGNGKSTLFKLLLGFYNNFKGHILFDDINITNIDKQFFYHNLISFVGQEPVLFDGSILDNLFSFNPVNQDDLNFILPLIDDFFHNNNNINNIKLSGGQKQRISICRAILRKPKILLFDEPTSALDIYNTNNFISFIKSLSITSLIISHDDSLLQQLSHSIVHI